MSLSCLNHLPNDKILALSKLKAFADCKFNVAEMAEVLCCRIENVGKGENAAYHYSLLFSQCFQKASITGS